MIIDPYLKGVLILGILLESGKEPNVTEQLDKLLTRLSRTSPPSFKKYLKGLLILLFLET